jgi:hypothetical protein
MEVTAAAAPLSQSPKEVTAAAAPLSQTAQRFLEYVARDPERARHLDHLEGDYPDWLRAYSGKFYPLQSWPDFVGAEKRAEMSRATVELTRLVKAIPERLFENDPRRIAAYFGLYHEALVTLLLEPPNGLEGMWVRNDFVDSPDGWKCLEVNAGQIGGWEMRYFDHQYRTNPTIARFLEEEGLRPYYRDQVEMLLQHVIADNLGKPTTADGVLNAAIAVSRLEAAMEESQPDLNQTYQDVLAASGTGLTGELTFCYFADLVARQNQVWHTKARLPIHAIIEMTPQQTPETVFRCFKAGQVSLYNGPINYLAADKRNLALLSEHADSTVFTAEERDFLHSSLPWTRLVTAGPATWRGETRPLPDLLIAHREELVLKPSSGVQGQGVTLGRLATPERWARLVERAVAQGEWLAQERVDSRPYIYQAGERGYGVHDCVWGIFCFGATYAGAFPRMVLKDTGDGVINCARGAELGILWEV